MTRVQFCRCLCTSSAGLAYETSRAVPIHRESGSAIPEGLYQLHAFFTAGNLGYMPVSHPFTSLMHSDLLGSGMSSRVFAICNQDNHILKVMTDEEDCAHESAMLRITEKEKIPHVPRLIEAGQGALVLSPRATPIVVGQLHCRHALQIPDTLETIHKISLYHRDIHPANLMLVGHDILINNWGCTGQGDEDVDYAGSMPAIECSGNSHLATLSYVRQRLTIWNRWCAQRSCSTTRGRPSDA